MPAKRALAEPRDVVYLYDGGLAGFFNCVYESVYEHELPAAIVTEQDPQPSLMLQKRIAADPGRAVRVRNPYVDALSLAQVRALREVRMNQDQLSEEAKAEYMSLILSTVTGVSAGLQNTG